MVSSALRLVGMMQSYRNDGGRTVTLNYYSIRFT